MLSLEKKSSQQAFDCSTNLGCKRRCLSHHNPCDEAESRSVPGCLCRSRVLQSWHWQGDATRGCHGNRRMQPQQLCLCMSWEFSEALRAAPPAPGRTVMGLFWGFPPPARLSHLPTGYKPHHTGPASLLLPFSSHNAHEGHSSAIISIQVPSHRDAVWQLCRLLECSGHFTEVSFTAEEALTYTCFYKPRESWKCSKICTDLERITPEFTEIIFSPWKQPWFRRELPYRRGQHQVNYCWLCQCCSYLIILFTPIVISPTGKLL